MPRSIEGQGLRITRKPPSPWGRRCPVLVDNFGDDAWEGDLVALPGLVGDGTGQGGEIMMAPVSVCHQVSTMGQRPPADLLVIPHPGLGVDRLADGAQNSETGKIVLGSASGRPI